jgi:hypothetical protein
MKTKFYSAEEAAEVLGYTHVESFRRAARKGWLKDRLNPVPGKQAGFHHNSLAYPIHEVDAAAGF